MSIHITKNRIRATGSDANALFIALASDEQVMEWASTNHGGEEFRRMVQEALCARGLDGKLKKPRTKPLTQALRDEVVRYYRQGWSRSQIAGHMGISPQQVGRARPLSLRQHRTIS